MAFEAPRFGSPQFGLSQHSARRHGAGLATWNAIQDILAGGGRRREEKPPLAGGVGQVLPEALRASNEPSRYEASAAGEPYAGEPTLTKMVEGLAPSENFETQFDAMSEQRAPTYAGRAMKPYDYENVQEMQRAEQEYKLALDKSATLGGQLMRGWSQDRIDKARAKYEMAIAKVQSRVPMEEKLGSTIVRRDTDTGAYTTVAAEGQRVRPGEAVYHQDTGKSEFPAGKQEYQDVQPTRHVGHDARGREYILSVNPDGSTSTKFTGNTVRMPADPNDPGRVTFWSDKTARDEKGQPILDANGQPKIVQVGINAHGREVPGTEREKVAPQQAGGATSAGPGAGAGFKPPVAMQAKDVHALVEKLDVGQEVDTPDGKTYIVVMTGHGKDIVLKGGKTVSSRGVTKKVK